MTNAARATPAVHEQAAPRPTPDLGDLSAAGLRAFFRIARDVVTFRRRTDRAARLAGALDVLQMEVGAANRAPRPRHAGAPVADSRHLQGAADPVAAARSRRHLDQAPQQRAAVRRPSARSTACWRAMSAISSRSGNISMPCEADGRDTNGLQYPAGRENWPHGAARLVARISRNSHPLSRRQPVRPRRFTGRFRSALRARSDDQRPSAHRSRRTRSRAARGALLRSGLRADHGGVHAPESERQPLFRRQLRRVLLRARPATAIAETRYHSALFLDGDERSAAAPADASVHGDGARRSGGSARTTTGEGGARSRASSSPDDYGPGKALGRAARKAGAPGIVYPSVRDAEGECLAAFRTTMLRDCRHAAHLEYNWNGETIDYVLETNQIG